MLDIECPTPAYERLRNSGLEQKIIKNKDGAYNLLIGASGINIYEENHKKIFKKAEEVLSKDGKITERTELYRDILNFKILVENYDEFSEEKEQVIIENPTFLAFLVLGEELLSYEKYGFLSRRKLEESVASYCIGEKIYLDLSNHGNYIWRNKDKKNVLSNAYHGDFHASQTDVSGEERVVSTLLGKETVFDTKKDCSGLTSRMNGHDGNWKNFLVTVLKYAEAMGKSKSYEIVNWMEVLEEVGYVGVFATEAEFGDGTNINDLRFLMEEPILAQGREKEIDTFPLTIYGGSDNYFIPYIYQENLLFMAESQKGTIKLPFEKGVFAEKNYLPIITYNNNDLPELLKGTYRLFARDRSNLTKIMHLFLTYTYKNILSL